MDVFKQSCCGSFVAQQIKAQGQRHTKPYLLIIPQNPETEKKVQVRPRLRRLNYNTIYILPTNPRKLKKTQQTQQLIRIP
jgi:hypothetical protein